MDIAHGYLFRKIKTKKYKEINQYRKKPSFWVWGNSWHFVIYLSWDLILFRIWTILLYPINNLKYWIDKANTCKRNYQRLI